MSAELKARFHAPIPAHKKREAKASHLYYYLAITPIERNELLGWNRHKQLILIIFIQNSGTAFAPITSSGKIR